MDPDSILVRAHCARSILKGFEIAAKDAQPMSIMTSYNLIKWCARCKLLRYLHESSER